jgi:hypothetical protein
MIVFLEVFDAIDDSSCPLNDQGFKTISLVEIGVHILFHGFSSLVSFFAFLIESCLLGVHIIDKVLKLAECQLSLRSSL